MLSKIKTYLANQARKPSGWFGRIVAPRVFEKTNEPMENFGLKHMDPEKDDHILEIGFGHRGLISEIMPKIEDGKMCGIDISEQMVNIAAKRNKNWVDNSKLEIEQASIADIPYPDKHFDKVFTCNTIYFWPNPKKNLEEVKQVLKPSGKFLCAFRDKKLMQSKSSAVTENREIFQNLYHPEEIQQLFQKADFQKTQIHSKTSNSETTFLAMGS